jgi:hypothetical protein
MHSPDENPRVNVTSFDERNCIKYKYNKRELSNNNKLTKT